MFGVAVLLEVRCCEAGRAEHTTTTNAIIAGFETVSPETAQIWAAGRDADFYGAEASILAKDVGDRATSTA
jgi:hypothetical protein